MFSSSIVLKKFEIFDIEKQVLSRGIFLVYLNKIFTYKIILVPDPPEWRVETSIAFHKDKLYYIGGRHFKSADASNHVDVRVQYLLFLAA